MTRLRSWLGLDPVILIVLGVGVLAAFTVLGWQFGGEDDPIRDRRFTSPTLTDDAPTADVAGVVSEGANGVFTVQDSAGAVELAIPAGALIQVLQRIDPSDVRVDDWVIVGGDDDNVNSFIVRGVVVIDPSEVEP